jgi:hypothetical protein
MLVVTEIKRPFRVIRCADTYGYVPSGKNVLHAIGPFDCDYSLGIFYRLSQFPAHEARIIQAVKIKVIDTQLTGYILITDRKTWTMHRITAAGTRSQTFYESGLAASQVTRQLEYLAAPQSGADPLRQGQGIL